MKEKDDLDRLFEECMQNPEFRTAWQESENEWNMLRAIYDAREQAGMTQWELSKRTGISQADISRLERGNGNPSIRKLNRIARGLGMRVRIIFEPMQKAE